MTSDLQDLPLAAEFPPATREDWTRLVDGVLKGADFERLVSRSADGLRIGPIYPRAPQGEVIAGRDAARPWEIVQRLDHPDAAQANALALTDLENGATALSIIFAGSGSARGFGLPADAASLSRALAGIHADAGIVLELELPWQHRDLAQAYRRWLDGAGVAPRSTQSRFALDPVGEAARSGNAIASPADIAAGVAQIAALGFTGPVLLADGRVIHDAGGSEAQELAFVLASGVAYLRALTEAGVPLDEARGRIHARLSADADQFLSLAKFRALRLLWAEVERNCGLAPRRLLVGGETAWRMLTRRDPYVNLLRATMAVFAAGTGGAGSICVLPHTLALGLPDALARRIARNIQLILLEESNLDKVSDPAAGSGGIEALTGELAAAAWTLFQEIEGAGGVMAALEAGLVQDKVAAMRAARDTAIGRRKAALTGVSEFPHLAEAPVAVLAPAPPAAPAGATRFAPLAPMRLAAGFEALRDRSDAVLAATGRRPRVFLANLGSPSDFTARTTFARSFFEAGGIEAVASDGGDAAAQVAAWRDSTAALVCLCSSDKVYAAEAPAMAAALRAAGARHLYLAGRPGELEVALREAGIGGFIFAGDDALKALTTAHRLASGDEVRS
jgi:methylmalonyl-CoA mutase